MNKEKALKNQGLEFREDISGGGEGCISATHRHAAGGNKLFIRSSQLDPSCFAC